LCIWDRRRQSLLLARDPSGIKPLFFRRDPDTLAFASEIKSLIVDPRVPRQPDVTALAGYLAYLYVPPPATALRGIERLLPGEAMEVTANGCRRWRYHQFAVAPKQVFTHLDAAADALESVLAAVVAEQQVADVPVGAFLSGGIDSGLLVALMARQRARLGVRQPLLAFTVGFGGDGADETAAAAALAQSLGVQHRVLTVQADAVAAGLDAVVTQFDEPFGNPTALLTDLLCQFARREVTVALSGDGGDEAFGGYPRYRATRALGLWARLPAGLRDGLLVPLVDRLPERRGPTAWRDQARRMRRFVHAAQGPFAHTYRDWLGHYSATGLHQLLQPAAWAEVEAHLTRHDGDVGSTTAALAGLAADTDPLDAACLADVYGFLPDNVLALSDRMSMRHALELRVPYADDRVLDFGLRLEPRWKMTAAALAGSSGKNASKRVLRHVAARHLPNAVVARPKQGFVAPMAGWIAGPLAPLMQQTLSESRIAARGLVDPAAVTRMHAEHRSGQRDHTWHLWSLLVLERWWQLRVDAPPDCADRAVTTVEAQPLT
jgi:asparagine synthase (glutamine-hydrolysing)